MLSSRYIPPMLLASLLCLAMVLPVPVAAQEKPSGVTSDAVILDAEDEDNESGFGIRWPWWGSKSDKSDSPEPAEEAVANEKPIIIDQEDEDNESGFGIPIRFPGDKKSREKDKEQGYEPVDPETYRVVIDHEDEDNESGFGIPLPTEDDPTPWRKPIDQSTSDGEDD